MLLIVPARYEAGIKYAETQRPAGYRHLSHLRAIQTNQIQPGHRNRRRLTALGLCKFRSQSAIPFCLVPEASWQRLSVIGARHCGALSQYAGRLEMTSRAMPPTARQNERSRHFCRLLGVVEWYNVALLLQHNYLSLHQTLTKVRALPARCRSFNAYNITFTVGGKRFNKDQCKHHIHQQGYQRYHLALLLPSV